MVGPHSIGQYSGGPLSSGHQQTVQITIIHSSDFPRACTPWKSLPPICLAQMLLQRSPVLVLVSRTWSSQAVSHPSTLNYNCNPFRVCCTGPWAALKSKNTGNLIWTRSVTLSVKAFKSFFQIISNVLTFPFSVSSSRRQYNKRFTSL